MYFKPNVLVMESKTTLEVPRSKKFCRLCGSRQGSKLERAWRAGAGNGGESPECFYLSVHEHETQSYIGRRVSVHSYGFRSLHLTLGSHVEQQGFQYYWPETDETLRS